MIANCLLVKCHVQNDSELFASAVSLFPLLDPENLLEKQRAEFSPYIEYVKAPVAVPVPDIGETKNSMSHYFLNEENIIPVVLAGLSA